jgi:hypothetical protein
MYKQLNLDLDINIKQLQKEVLDLYSNKDIFTKVFEYQLGLTYEDDNCKNKFADGAGSLALDYINQTEEEHRAGIRPPPRTRKVAEQDFNKIVPELKGLYLYEILEQLQHKFNIGRTRLMLSKPKTCLTWHNDSTYRIHIPIFTQEGCIMVWENCTIHMPEGSLYWADTTKLHTAFNGSFKERIHLVATVQN